MTVIFYARRGFPFTDLKLTKLAYELAVANKRKGFSPVKKMAGPWWLKGFLQWWPDLKKKNAKNLSLHRAACANAYQVAKVLRLYKELLDKFDLNYKPFNIWNIDETGIPDIPREQKVIGVKGEQCSQTVPGKKPVNTTLLTFVSAGGCPCPQWSSSRAPRLTMKLGMLPLQVGWSATQSQGTFTQSCLQKWVKNWLNSSRKRSWKRMESICCCWTPIPAIPSTCTLCVTCEAMGLRCYASLHIAPIWCNLWMVCLLLHWRRATSRRY